MKTAFDNQSQKKRRPWVNEGVDSLWKLFRKKQPLQN